MGFSLLLRAAAIERRQHPRFAFLLADDVPQFRSMVNHSANRKMKLTARCGPVLWDLSPDCET
jgi:hypothetical protein